jgi:hypothetical protein
MELVQEIACSSSVKRPKDVCSRLLEYPHICFGEIADVK